MSAHLRAGRRERRAARPTTALLAVALVLALTVATPVGAAPAPANGSTATRPGPEAPSSDPASSDASSAPGDVGALARFDAAIAAGATAGLRGRLTVASFGESGPQLTVVDVARRSDGRIRARQEGVWELGRDDDGSYLRSSRTGRLLELGGVRARSFDRDRFLVRYDVRDRGRRQLDTGPAQELEVVERGSGAVRELLHVDEATGLIVRRETRDVDGTPLRLVAFTSLEVDGDVAASPTEAADDAVQDDRETIALEGVELAALRERDVPAVDTLPGGFVLLDAAEVGDPAAAAAGTVHLVFGDGLYTLSVYVQPGRLARRATRAAVPLDLGDGRTVWRWPGSEPRRVVWSGDGHTFTAVSDAPTGVLTAAVAGLPNDPPPSTLARLVRGFSRLAELLPPWGDDAPAPSAAGPLAPPPGRPPTH